MTSGEFFAAAVWRDWVGLAGLRVAVPPTDRTSCETTGSNPDPRVGGPDAKHQQPVHWLDGNARPARHTG